MPNAKDIQEESGYKVMLIGPAGSGKTTAFQTLKGRKFLYVFDPNALRTLRGADVDYELFDPDIHTFALASLSSKVQPDRPTVNRRSTQAYIEWERHFEGMIQSKKIQDYDWVGFDSGTTFQELIMDRILELNGRAGQWPHEDDYGPVMNTYKNIIRAATSLKNKEGHSISIFVTGHYDTVKNGLTGELVNLPILYGKLRAKIPLLFSEYLIAEAKSVSGKTSYLVHTQPSGMNPGVRCSLRGVDSKLDVTIDWNKPIEGQGFGKYFK